MSEAPHSDLERRARRLRALLRHHRKLYYLDQQPTITDVEYDALEAELAQIERENPDLATPDSPTRTVGASPEGGLPRRPHVRKMLSLANCYDEGDLREFDRRVREVTGLEKVTYALELKVDGVSLALSYVEGILDRALTRGNGIVGEEVTENARRIRGLPLYLDDAPPSLLVQGEVYLPRQTFLALNRERAEQGLALFANPRNSAAGAIRMLDPDEVGRRRLRFQAWNIDPVTSEERDGFPDSQIDRLSLGAELGIAVSEHRELGAGLSAVTDFYSRWTEGRRDLPFDVDGIVVKVDRLSLRASLGATSKAPRWAIAYKFPATQARTRILDISVQVGRTGRLTPVAELEPVELCGTTVKRATLHNQDEIARKDIRRGDFVFIEKGGEIIPKVVSVITAERSAGSRPYRPPTRCPACGGPVEREPDAAASRCTNPDCPEILVQSLLHFASREAMDIGGLGEVLVRTLVERRSLRTISDLYRLDREQLASLPRMGAKSAENLLAEIAKSKQVTLSRFLYALGIPSVGVRAARLIARIFGSIDALLAADEERLRGIRDVGPETAQSVVTFARSERGAALLRELFDCGVAVNPEVLRGGLEPLLAGKKVVLTGELPYMSRREAASLVELLGGQAVASVSRKTDLLVAGDRAGSKLGKARDRGVRIINAEEFRKLLEEAGWRAK